jgi:hypothetical protein
MANLSWAKDAVMVQAVREITYDAANEPSKCPVNRGFRQQKSSPIRFSEAAE